MGPRESIRLSAALSQSWSRQQKALTQDNLRGAGRARKNSPLSRFKRFQQQTNPLEFQYLYTWFCRVYLMWVKSESKTWGHRDMPDRPGHRAGRCANPHSTQAPFASRQNMAIWAAVSLLISGQQLAKISMPWVVPITCLQRAGTPARSRLR